MARAKIVLDSVKRFVGIEFHCPGCKHWHLTPTRQPLPGYELSHYYTSGATWDWNGSLDLPVLGPSVLMRSGHYARGNTQPGNCYCDYAERHPGEPPMAWSCLICHSFVGCNGAQPGQIIFLNDCTHALAGQTVDLPEIVHIHKFTLQELGG